MQILNMDNPSAVAFVWKVDHATNTVAMTIDGEDASYRYTAACKMHVIPSGGTWNEGDRYGTELFARQQLAKGFEFDPDPLTQPQAQRIVLFRADGTVDTGSHLSQLLVVETIKKGTDTNRLVFTISPNGKISQGK